MQMADLERVIRIGLEEDNIDNRNDEKGPLDFPLMPLASKPIYWFYNEVVSFLTRQTSLDEFLDTIVTGEEAIWRADDPMPFLILNFVQMPLLLLKSLFLRKTYNKVNFCLGQVL